MVTTEGIIAGLPVFENFSPEEVLILAKHAAVADFKAGELLLIEGRVCDKFYYILEGIISLQVFSPDTGILELETAQTGELLGCNWLATDNKSNFDAIAFEDTRTIIFDAMAVKNEMMHSVGFGFKMYHLFTPLILTRFQTACKNIIGLIEKRF